MDTPHALASDAAMDLMKNPVTTLIAAAYVRAPRRADAVVHVIRRYVLPALRYRIPVRRLRGRTADGSPGSMLVAGAGPNLDYMTRRFFDGSCDVEPLGFAGPLSLARRLDRLEDGDDLVLARIGWPAVALMDERYLRVPDLVDMWLEVAGPEEALRRAGSELRRNVRALSQTGLSCSISHHPADFERFYDHYYTPFVGARFGDLAVVEARAVLRRRFRFGGLMWIEKDGKAIVGQLFEPKGDVLRLLSVGTLHGREEHRNLGALEMTRLFGLEQACAAGKRWLALGGSMPSLEDGSLKKKRAWGGVLRDRENGPRELAVRWSRFNHRVARFLDDVPLVIRDGGELSSLTAMSFEAPLDPGAAFRRWRQLAPRDLHRFYIAGQGWQSTRTGTALPPPGKVWLCDPAPSRSILSSAREATGAG